MNSRYRLSLPAAFVIAIGVSMPSSFSQAEDPKEREAAERRFRQLCAFGQEVNACIGANQSQKPEERRARVMALPVRPAEIREWVDGPCHRTNRVNDLEFVAKMKGVCRYLAVVAETASAEGRPDDALDSAVDMFLLGSRVREGGTMSDQFAAGLPAMFAPPVFATEVPKASREALVRCLGRLPDAGQMDATLNARIATPDPLPNGMAPPPQIVKGWKKTVEDRESLRLAEIQLTRVLLALHIYRHDRDRYPAELKDLVPAILASTPVDAFSGRPLVYRREGNSFALYSMGPDRKDDGGLKMERSELLAGKKGDLRPY